jgi:hypothetical protein
MRGLPRIPAFVGVVLYVGVYFDELAVAVDVLAVLAPGL